MRTGLQGNGTAERESTAGVTTEGQSFHVWNGLLAKVGVDIFAEVNICEICSLDVCTSELRISHLQHQAASPRLSSDPLAAKA